MGSEFGIAAVADEDDCSVPSTSIASVLRGELVGPLTAGGVPGATAALTAAVGAGTDVGLVACVPFALCVLCEGKGTGTGIALDTPGMLVVRICVIGPPKRFLFTSGTSMPKGLLFTSGTGAALFAWFTGPARFPQ